VCLTCGCTDSPPFQALETSLAATRWTHDAEHNLVATIEVAELRTDHSTARTPWPVITTGIGNLAATVQIPSGR
jgi:hypothetical protein